MQKLKQICLLFTFLTYVSFASAKSFYVSATAAASGDGSFVNPWQFQTALNHPKALQPGDTVWVKGGVYTNTYDAQTSFSCRTNGTANLPIIFRNFNNERAIIDGQLVYSIYAGLGNCSYTWFWGFEVTNSKSVDRNHDIYGSVTCTAENMKFINIIIHDTGSGIDCWKTAKNSETYGCIIYHIGNNLLNGTNWEGHGHGMYLQNDTVGTKLIHNNIVFSMYGYGIKVWQTTTTAALGNFDIQKNIVFNGGSASENLGGVGNNSRTHNFFVVANGANNPVRNTVIKHNYTYSGINTPRPPVNAFGLNYGVVKMTLDSNYLTCQTRLGFNNTPVFDASVKGNKIIGGIPSVYGVPLWGFLQTDYPQNTYITGVPTNGLEYFVIPNKYEKGTANIAIYNWDSASTVKIDISKIGLKSGDEYQLINVMDYFKDIATGTYTNTGMISVSMINHTSVLPIGSKQMPASQFPKFGAFVIRKTGKSTIGVNESLDEKYFCITPNPSNGKFSISNCDVSLIEIFNTQGKMVYSTNVTTRQIQLEIDLSVLSKGIYFLRKSENSNHQTYKISVQ